MPEQLSAEATVDARGKVCPVPILELAKALRPMAAGATVCVLATDRAFELDVRAFCESTNSALVALEVEGGCYRAYVRKAAR
jgi:TusA-related sulfurtransferase